MTRVTAQCPSCGAPVEWISAASVQTTCRYCTSVIVRTDVDLRDVGVKSSVPPTVSPIRLGTRGSYKGRRFEVIGRLVYAYERGRWNEWHLLYDDGATGWLSDAQAEYAITALAPSATHPPAEQVRPGMNAAAGGEQFTITAVTRARYAGTEGELPFEKWDASVMVFADLRGERGSFGTIDYSERPPLLYLGRSVSFDELGLSELREPEQIKAAARTLACPNCGGAVSVRAADHTVNVVCQHCASVLDARTPGFQVLAQYQSRLSRKPKIQLGTTGTLHGREWEVIGFQVRSIRVENRDYPWDEYLLFSPRHGFQYLTEYHGHWSLGATIRSVPRKRPGVRPSVELDGRVFRHFQRATAETTFVIGEFPWEVRSGDTAAVSDYVAPPYMLSSEETQGEVTWTRSEYLPGDVVWKGFGLQGKAPAAQGVYANQPTQAGPRARSRWKVGLLLLAALVVLLFVRFGQGGATVASESASYQPSWGAGAEGEQGRVIGPLTVGGRTSNLEVNVQADVDNSWAYFDFALADSAGRATQFGREVSYYRGVDGGESWSEGSQSKTVKVPSVPPGRYWLRVEPQGEQPFNYWVTVRRDVPSVWMFVAAALLLLLPPLLSSVQAGMFEAARWAESDYAPSSDE
ncbi:MAG TPA: DUF4178 domain-containing protein [Longimicrobium sp.]|nr:DUF4178 domain-containing protein [Longimicrobium sp.]